MPRAWQAVLVTVLVSQAGCARETTRPTVTDVRLAVSATPAVGSPAHPVAIAALVTNAGDTRVWHCDGCGCGSGIGVTVRGPDGAVVFLTDPNALPPMCPDGRAPLEPGRVLGSRGVFTGTLYQSGHSTIPTPTYPAPPGTYTVSAGFGYALGATEEWIPLERGTTFVWQP